MFCSGGGGRGVNHLNCHTGLVFAPVWSGKGYKKTCSLESLLVIGLKQGKEISFFGSEIEIESD